MNNGRTYYGSIVELTYFHCPHSRRLVGRRPRSSSQNRCIELQADSPARKSGVDRSLKSEDGEHGAIYFRELFRLACPYRSEGVGYSPREHISEEQVLTPVFLGTA
jgi:hypothetical protein